MKKINFTCIATRGGSRVGCRIRCCGHPIQNIESRVSFSFINAGVFSFINAGVNLLLIKTKQIKNIATLIRNK